MSEDAMTGKTERMLEGLVPGTWWQRRAMALQMDVQRCEYDKVTSYGDDEVRQATVHTRQDLILVLSYLDSANLQLAAIKKALYWIVGGLGAAAFAAFMAAVK